MSVQSETVHTKRFDNMCTGYTNPGTDQYSKLASLLLMIHPSQIMGKVLPIKIALKRYFSAVIQVCDSDMVIFSVFGNDR